MEEWNSASGRFGEPQQPVIPMLLHTPFATFGGPRLATVWIGVKLTVKPNIRAISIPFCRLRVIAIPTWRINAA